MNTRLATAADSSAVRALIGELHTNGFDELAFDEAFGKIVESSDRVVIVVEDDGQVVGSAVVNLVQKLPGLEARIDEVIVSNKSRGKGYGKVLMQACDAWAFENGATSIEFTSRPSREAANALYQKLGYQLRETNVYQRKKD